MIAASQSWRKWPAASLTNGLSNCVFRHPVQHPLVGRHLMTFQKGGERCACTNSLKIFVTRSSHLRFHRTHLTSASNTCHGVQQHCYLSDERMRWEVPNSNSALVTSYLARSGHIFTKSCLLHFQVLPHPILSSCAYGLPNM